MAKFSNVSGGKRFSDTHTRVNQQPPLLFPEATINCPRNKNLLRWFYTPSPSQKANLIPKASFGSQTWADEVLNEEEK
jgi:hypothetical protein